MMDPLSPCNTCYQDLDFCSSTKHRTPELRVCKYFATFF